MTLRGRRVLVVGAASSGLAAARVLLDAAARVRITEARTREAIGSSADAVEAGGAELHAGGHLPEHLDGIELVVTSPGVPEHADVLRWAAERGIRVWSELEVGARIARAPYVGITGTNGKTTTTEMVAAAMREAGLDAIACGNVGHPFSLAASEGHDALAVEASSFQLRFHETFHPRVSVLLNLAEDHLDWHGSFDAYRDAKRRIFQLQGPDDTHVGNRDDVPAAELSSSAPCPVVWFTAGPPRRGDVGYDGDVLVGSDGGVLGEPAGETPAHRLDAAAAAAAGRAFGLDPAAVASALTSFAPLPHRGEVVADAGGVAWVDDSKATNPHAALASISGRKRVVLVAGGRSKGVDLTPLREGLPSLIGVVALGEATEDIVRLFAGNVPVKRAGSIEDAVERAARLAPPGATVLLAPACASQDMFRDYRERGERFTAAARRIASRSTGEMAAAAGDDGGRRA